MDGMRDFDAVSASKTALPIRLVGLLVAQLCVYSTLSALCFAVPALLARPQWFVNAIWCRRGYSVYTGRACDSGWRSIS